MRELSLRQQLFGIDVDALRLDEVVERCVVAVDKRRPVTIGVINAAKIIKLRKDPELAASVINSDLVLADGQSVVWASRLMRRPLPERVAGIDLFERLLEQASARGDAVFFLGATDEVLARMLDRVARDYPGLRVAGSLNGYFPWETAGEVSSRIRASGAQLLFIGMTSPRKERFLDQFGDASGAMVRHGVGGSFDVLAGVTRRAPAAWQRLGMEWLYRVLQEPRRLWKSVPRDQHRLRRGDGQGVHPPFTPTRDRPSAGRTYCSTERLMSRVVVLGQGYVGLPISMRAVEVGHTVVGYDVDVDRVKALAAGESYVEDIPPSRSAVRWTAVGSA